MIRNASFMMYDPEMVRVWFIGQIWSRVLVIHTCFENGAKMLRCSAKGKYIQKMDKIEAAACDQLGHISSNQLTSQEDLQKQLGKWCMWMSSARLGASLGSGYVMEWYGMYRMY